MISVFSLIVHRHPDQQRKEIFFVNFLSFFIHRSIKEEKTSLFISIKFEFQSLFVGVV
jgi:hypothetical protein